MDRPLTVYHVKPRQVVAWSPPAVDGEPGFVIELEHRVWLARFGPSHADPSSYGWDDHPAGIGLPDTWRPSPLSTVGFGGTFRPGELRPAGVAPDAERAWGPVPGDRVVAYRRRCQDIVGVWLVTGARFRADGEVLYGVRPLLSCLQPVHLPAHRRVDADLAQSWDPTFGRQAARRGALLPLEGSALAGVMRSVGIEPRLLCGPQSGLVDCSLSNRPPGRGFRAATRLQTTSSPTRRIEERALAEAVDWIFDGCFPGFDPSRTDVETVGTGDLPGTHLVVRSVDGLVHQATSIGFVGPDPNDIELCPTVVHEAVDADRSGRGWSLFATLDALGAGRTVRFEARAVALCFDSSSGRVANPRDH